MGSQLQSWINQIQSAITGKPQVSPTGIRRIDRWIEFLIEFWKKSKNDLQNSNPLNIFLSLIIIYLIYSLVKPNSISKLTPTLTQARSTKKNSNSSYSFLPDQHPPSTVWKKYTPRTLAIHDGSGAMAEASAGGASSSTTSNGNSSKRNMKSSSSQTINQNQILLAIDGKVFDVTKGGNFYGPGGPYGNFAGRDASRGMAKQSFDLEMLTPLDQRLDLLKDLTPMERNNMNEWVSHFTAKYTIVGELVNEGEEGDD